ncbi:hypothetical protein [Streptomyces vietnamensis]|uniref:Shufflon protein B n=1 Tax=Streptomyces vietnamensis TaxID=362257 RepID=A0A0B5IDN9_9ACTN|nr:hypothetical protein [Streptomyces vietnamensis]AJF66479.1 hypothetical protein SVTN_20965 [Streptomyces vietnamensis]
MLKKSLVVAAAATMAFAAAGVAVADDVVRVVESAEVTIPVASGGYPGRAVAQAECPAGETRTGGGALVTAGNSYADRYAVGASVPVKGEGWWAFATNTDPNNPGKLKAYAICAKVVKNPTLVTP